MRSSLIQRMFVGAALTAGLCLGGSLAQAETSLKLLFLGDNGHHQPARRFQELEPVLQKRGIELRYTDNVADLKPETLSQYDGLIVYANIDEIQPEQATALLDYVASGKGFIPLHCASYCFRNSPEVVALIGAQFKEHGTGEFTTEAAADHPIMRRFGGFKSWDETYVHTLHNEKDRTVLEYRVEGGQAQGNAREPWTWVRTHGQGRVFYTAWGHDQRTFTNPGFQNLVERGIRWACGGDPGLAGPYPDPQAFPDLETTKPRTDVEAFDYVDVGPKIPNYTPNQEKWGVQGKPLNLMQKPLSPAESQKHFVTPVGFEMQLFVSEPELKGKPIAMNWDERGRLWVCETVDYPNDLQEDDEGNDRIRICEDTNGDGKADKFTVFAQKLSIPTALVPYRGGVIVQHATETLYLKDTNGDDKADIRKVLISNWEVGDTHGGVSNFRYGLDNWIWGMQGYNSSAPVINGRRQQSFGQGFFRFQLSQTDPPTVTALEFVRSTNNNTWGLGLSEEGLVFGSTANRHPSIYMPIANRYYERVRGWSPDPLETIADTYLFQAITDKVRQVDQHGGYTAGAGHALYTARTYPQEWWNRTAFVAEPTGHLVGAFVLKREGSDFYSTSPLNLVASDDEWSAPILAEVGPDGNVWVIDWYNYIVQHNPTPQGFKTGKGAAYVSELRDKQHGRIYRLVYTGPFGAGRAAPALSGSSPSAELISALKHPTMLVRLQAQRLLLERGQADVVPQLVELAQDQAVDEVGLNVGAIHALNTLKGLGALDEPQGAAYNAALAALAHPSAGVRRNALGVLPRDASAAQALLKQDAVHDKDAQVRLAALLAFSDMPADAENEELGALLVQLAQDANFTRDKWLREALTSAAATHAESFLPALAKVSETADGVRALRGAMPIVPIVAEHIARSAPQPAAVGHLLASLEKADPQFLAVVLQGLAKGWSSRRTIELPSEYDGLLVSLFQRSSTTGKTNLFRLAPLWGSTALDAHIEPLLESLLTDLKNTKAPTQQRLTAARHLIAIHHDDPATVDQILKLVTPQTPPAVASGLLEALTGSTAPGLADKVLARIGGSTPTVRSAAFKVLLARPQTTNDLLTAAENGKFRLTDLSLDQRQALNSHPNRALKLRARALLAAGGGLPDADRQKVLESKLVLLERQGDVEQGKLIFKQQCAKCHKHGGEGENIGPDLTGMATHPKLEMLTNIIDPSRSVEGNFRVYSVVTDSGRIYTGMLIGDTRTSVELVDAEAKRHAIQRDEIEELAASTKSLMPEGFEKQVNDDQLVHLLAFLSNKGPFLPLPLEKYATAVSTKGMFYDENDTVERLIFPDWKPKTFEGKPFVLVDPQGASVPNAIMLNGPLGKLPPQMPKSVTVPCNTPAKAIHLLSGVSGWGAQSSHEGGVSMIVRLHYADGQTEEHPLLDGQHFADYNGAFEVPQSKLAFKLRNQQIRYLSVLPQRTETIESIEFVKGADRTAPVVMAVTLEMPETKPTAHTDQ